LKLRIRDRLKFAFSPQNSILEVLQQYADDFLRGKDGPDTESTGPVSARRALRLSAVFACNRVLSETLASCPIFMYEKDEKGNRKSVTDAPQYELLHYAPNPDMTPVALKECGASNINLGGNFYVQKVKNAYGKVIQLRPIEWHRVRMDRNKQTGELEYFIDGGSEPYHRDSMLHIPGLTLNGYEGITPIEYAQSALKIGIYQDDYTRKFYENGVLSSGIFSYPNQLSDPAFQRLKKDLEKNYTGMKNAGIPMLLEEGGTFKEITMKLTDAQFIETKKFSVEDICRLYRVPLHLVQNLDRATNNNIEHQSLEFIIYTMLPWFKRWEENLNLQLLEIEDRRRNRYFEFKIDSLLRGDAKTRAEAYAQGRQWGWLSVNDIRRMENMNDIGPAGDIYLQPMNMIEAGSGKEQAQMLTSMYNKLVEEIYNMIRDNKN
jgi:HK97 family phage portal protein